MCTPFSLGAIAGEGHQEFGLFHVKLVLIPSFGHFGILTMHSRILPRRNFQAHTHELARDLHKE
jgi:hypothetical protein